MAKLFGRRWLVAAGLLLILAQLLLLPLFPTSLAAIGAWVVLGLPGVLLAALLFAGDHWLVRAFFGLCGGLALPALLLLALHALPGPLPWWLLLPVTNGLSVLLLVLLARLPAQAQPPERGAGVAWVPLALVLLVAAGLRLPLLNASEMQGDEARALLLATGIGLGHDEALLVHKKGPVEVLLPAAPLVLLGRVDEGAARLPFALAGLGVVLGTYLLGRRMFGDADGPAVGLPAAIVAATVVALDGFMVAFSRIVQYQSVLLLMGLGALYLCWRFYDGEERPLRNLCVAAVLAAVGLLAHYDGVYVLPALAWLVVAGGRRRGWSAAAWLRNLAPPVLIGAGLLASFYLPFALNERFGRTIGYLFDRAGQGGGGITLYNNLYPRFYLLATFYSTTFQIHWLAVALLAGLLCWLLRYVWPWPLGVLLAAVLLAGSYLLWTRDAIYEIGPDGAQGNWALWPFAVPLAALVLAPRTPMAIRVPLLWFAGAFLTHGFLLVKPQTHFYTMIVPAALLIGLACARLAAWLQGRRLGLLRLPFALAGLGLAALALPYMAVVYVRQWPPYQLTFPKGRPAIYRAAYDDDLPQRGGYFGFPHNSGWKVVGALYDQGLLYGDYSSNEEELVTGWYTRGAFRCNSKPVYYFVAKRPRDFQKIPRNEIREDYRLWGTVVDNDETIMEIFTRLPVAQPRTLQADDYRPLFDNRQVASFPLERSLMELLPQYAVQGEWQYGASLRGFDLDHRELAAGRWATIALYWKATQPLGEGYEAFVEARDAAGRVVAEGRPHCGVDPSENWHTRRVATTAFTLGADTPLPPGTYTLWAGLRSEDSGEPMPLRDGGSSVQLATITMAASEEDTSVLLAPQN